MEEKTFCEALEAVDRLQDHLGATCSAKDGEQLANAVRGFLTRQHMALQAARSELWRLGVRRSDPQILALTEVIGDGY